MAQVDMTDVAKSYGGTAVLRDVNLHIASGEFVVLVGPSGSGKSTLLRMISGLESVTSGTIRIDGRVVNGVEPSGRGVAMPFQLDVPGGSLNGSRSTSSRLQQTGEATVSFSTASAGIAGTMDHLEYPRFGDRWPQVSNGHAPRLFLFDEPAANIDVGMRNRMRSRMKDLHREFGRTTIYGTHDRLEAMALADRIVVLNDGRIQQVGRPLEIYDDPDNIFVAGFTGSPHLNLFTGRCDDAGQVIADAPFVLPLPEKVEARDLLIGIRSEHVEIVDETRPYRLGRIKMAATVKFVETRGNVSYIHVKLDGGTNMVICDHRRWSGDWEVMVAFDPRKALIFDMAGRRLRPGAEP
ncbi:MAG: ABC transporter ATP-binding protein [Geminicoccaceae bacterium]